MARTHTTHHPLALLILTSTLWLSCSDKTPENVNKINQNQDLKSDSKGLSSQQDLIQSISWGTFQDHPLKPEFERCHVLSTRDLGVLYLHQLEQQGHNYPDPRDRRLMWLYGVSFSQDTSAFDKERKLKELRVQFSKELKAIINTSSLCISHELALNEYDFDKNRYPFALHHTKILCSECEHTLSLQNNDPPEDIKPQAFDGKLFVLDFFDFPRSFPIPAEQAEALLTIPPRFNQKNDFDSPRLVKKEEPTNDSNTPVTPDITAIQPHIYFMNQADPTQIVALVRDHSQSTPTTRTKATVQTTSNQQLSHDEMFWIKQLFSQLKEQQSYPRLKALSIVDIHSVLEKERSGIFTPLINIHTDATIYLDKNNRVVNVLPDKKSLNNPDTFADLDDKERTRIAHAVCDQNLTHKSRTIMRNGALFDEITYTCSRCPLKANSHTVNSMEFTISDGYPGRFTAPWRAGLLIDATDCSHDDVTMDTSAKLLVERDLQGNVFLRSFHSGFYGYCRLLHDSTQLTQDIFLCEHSEEPPGEQLSLVRFDPQNREAIYNLPVLVGSESYPCQGEKVDSEVKDAGLKDLNGDGVPDIIITLHAEECPEDTATIKLMANPEVHDPFAHISTKYQPDAETSAFFSKF